MRCHIAIPSVLLFAVILLSSPASADDITPSDREAVNKLILAQAENVRSADSQHSVEYSLPHEGFSPGLGQHVAVAGLLCNSRLRPISIGRSTLLFWQRKPAIFWLAVVLEARGIEA